jgi:hypothetical protein
MKLQLAAIDTWFFRDSTPFHMNDSPQTGVVGMFPPYPATVAGAVRAALARQAGWDGQARWRDELVAVLGDGPADLGRLQITGPFLCDGAPAFPVPRHVVGSCEGGAGAAWTPKALLRPGRHEVPTASSSSCSGLPMHRAPRVASCSSMLSRSRGFGSKPT